MKLGIGIEETWDFFHEIHADLVENHQVSMFKQRQVHLPVFNERVNRYLFQNDMKKFTQANDVVFFEWASRLLTAASHLPKTCGIVTRLHRYEMYQWADRINWDNVDSIILVSQAKYQEFKTRFPAHISKVVVIPEAVSVERFQPQPKPFNGDIGILCHLKPRKRVYELILTFFELLEQRQDLHLHIGGGRAAAFGDYYEAIHELVKKLKIEDKVTFYGHISEPEQWYHKIDIYISNGYSEGLQVSPMEAMASGCYALSHFWDGADELLPEENLYFTSRDLRQKILAYCDLPDVQKQAQKDAMRARVCDKFNVDKTKQQIRRLIEEVA